jgi:acyl-coenzyme A synthetase/AMP-(fatty) acid ligase
MSAGGHLGRDWSSWLTQLTPAKSREYGAKGYWRDERLDQLVEHWAGERPDAVAVVDPRGRWTYADLWETSCRLAAALSDLEVARGDVVAYQLPNWRESIALVIACSRLGAVFSSIAPIFRERDLRRMLALAEPKVFITCDTFRGFDHAALGAQLAAELDPSPQVLIIGEGGAWDDWLSAAGSTPAPTGPDAQTVVQLAFTSGTTGEPKGILHTHQTLLHTPREGIARFGATADDCLHMAATLGHQSGVVWGICAPLVLGTKVVLQDVWDADVFCRLVESEGITWTCGAIPYLSDVLASPECERRDMSSLRLFGCFGSGLPETLAAETAKRLPGCTLYGGWGMTENGLPICNLPDDPFELVAGTEGLPVPGAEVQIRDAELREVLPPGTEGEMLFRGPSCHLGFVQLELSRSLFLDDGWYVTGDRGHLRDDGYFVMTGRSKDIIVRGGENIPVAEVENLLLKHPAIRFVAVVAYPDERFGERACACVQLRHAEPFDLGILRAWLETTGLTRQYWPERVEIFDPLPMTASGKIQKVELRALLAAEA